MVGQICLSAVERLRNTAAKGEIEGLFLEIGVNGHLLLKMAKQFGVECCRDKSVLTGLNGLFCPVNERATAVGMYVFDGQRFPGIVEDFECGLARGVPKECAKFMAHIVEAHLRRDARRCRQTADGGGDYVLFDALHK